MNHSLNNVDKNPRDANSKILAIEELATERGNTGGLVKRIDENRELLELLQERVPQFVSSHPWLVGWIQANDNFFTQLEGILETHQMLRMPKDYPRPWPGVREQALALISALQVPALIHLLTSESTAAVAQRLSEAGHRNLGMTPLEMLQPTIVQAVVQLRNAHSKLPAGQVVAQTNEEPQQVAFPSKNKYFEEQALALINALQVPALIHWLSSETPSAVAQRLKEAGHDHFEMMSRVTQETIVAFAISQLQSGRITLSFSADISPMKSI